VRAGLSAWVNRRHLGRRCDYRRRRSAPLQPARQAGHAGPARRRGDANCRRRGRPRACGVTARRGPRPADRSPTT